MSKASGKGRRFVKWTLGIVVVLALLLAWQGVPQTFAASATVPLLEQAADAGGRPVAQESVAQQSVAQYLSVFDKVADFFREEGNYVSPTHWMAGAEVSTLGDEAQVEIAKSDTKWIALTRIALIASVTLTFWVWLIVS